MGELGRRAASYALWAVIALGAGYVVWRFLLPILLPFIFAYLTAAVCEPVVELLTSRGRLRRGIASALCVLTVLSSAVGFFLLVVTRLFNEAVGLFTELPALASGLTGLAGRVEELARRAAASVPEGAREYLSLSLEAFSDRAAQIPAEVSAWALGKLSSAAAGAPGTALGLATYAIGSFFISSGYNGIRAFLSRQLPERLLAAVRRLRGEVLESLGRWLRAEAAIIGVVFALLTASLTLLRVEYGVVIALVTSLIDALPVFGSGVVLLPWAAVCLITDAAPRAAWLAVTYLAVTLTRSCLEPKLVGDEFGVAPAAALLAMYAGFKLLGVAGMVLFPFGLMVASELNTKGIIRLWK